MKDKEEFMEKWSRQRDRGKIKYILTKAGSAAFSGLAGVVAASIFLYNSPRNYSFAYYLPTYLFIFLGVFVIAALVHTYQWRKYEEKYSETHKQ